MEQAETRFTATDLVDAARAAGHDRVSPRLVVDWVGLGLLDRPERHGLGRGKGSTATWPDEQRQLFLALLGLRDQGAKIPPLCNVPVWLWLTWGDGYVPLEQTRRAMQTWAKAVGDPSAGRARAGVQALLQDWGDPRARRADRRALETAILPMVRTGQVNEAVLRPLVERVFDPTGTGRRGGPLSPEGYVRLLRARVEALKRLAVDAPRFVRGKRIDPFDDGIFEWARFMYVATRHSYGIERPRLAAGAEKGERFAPEGATELIMAACVDLATLLGLGVISPAGTAPGSIMDSTVWRKDGLRSSIQTSVADAGLDVAIQVEREGEEPEGVT
jgi:hypothetical protein